MYYCDNQGPKCKYRLSTDIGLEAKPVKQIQYISI